MTHDVSVKKGLAALDHYLGQHWPAKVDVHAIAGGDPIHALLPQLSGRHPTDFADFGMTSEEARSLGFVGSEDGGDVDIDLTVEILVGIENRIFPNYFT